MNEDRLLELLSILVDEITTPYFKGEARKILVDLYVEKEKEKMK